LYDLPLTILIMLPADLPKISNVLLLLLAETAEYG